MTLEEICKLAERYQISRVVMAAGQVQVVEFVHQIDATDYEESEPEDETQGAPDYNASLTRMAAGGAKRAGN